MIETSHFVYILQCEGGRFYTGYTKNLEKRFQQHLAGKGGMFTRLNKPVQIVYYERHGTQRAALRREREIKRLSRLEKEELISDTEGSQIPKRWAQVPQGTRRAQAGGRPWRD